jgi:DNA-binding PadR family transcriptional regulator
VTSTRLFILDELSRAESHGHGLRLRARQEHADVWTDIAVGGLYAALKRLSDEGHIAEARVEAAGNYPERTVYRITDTGREYLSQLQRAELERITFRMDPFDLAFTRANSIPPSELKAMIVARRDAFRGQAASRRADIDEVRAQLNVADMYAVEHLTGRLDYEADWHDRLLENFDTIIANFQPPEDTTG